MKSEYVVRPRVITWLHVSVGSCQGQSLVDLAANAHYEPEAVVLQCIYADGTDLRHRKNVKFCAKRASKRAHWHFSA